MLIFNCFFSLTWRSCLLLRGVTSFVTGNSIQVIITNAFPKYLLQLGTSSFVSWAYNSTFWFQPSIAHWTAEHTDKVPLLLEWSGELGKLKLHSSTEFGFIECLNKHGRSDVRDYTSSTIWTQRWKCMQYQCLYYFLLFISSHDYSEL